MHFVIFDTRKDLTFSTAGFFTQSIIFEITFDSNRELRITQRTGVLHLDERLMAAFRGLILGWFIHAAPLGLRILR
jgi:hypothetical protein